MIVIEKVFAKVNLTLDVLGTEGNYHEIESLAASISLFDTITLIKRKDRRVTLKNIGLPVNCPVHDNNAVKAATLFVKKFGTKGVNVIINKKIPVGGGLGGSSADVAGVLRGMKKLYDCDCDLKPLADELGSDAAYMLDGGYAVMRGRGTDVEKVKIAYPLYLLLISTDGEIAAKNCYKKFDEIKKTYPPCTEKTLEYLTNGKIKEAASIMKNDLQPAAESLKDLLFPELALKEAGAIKVMVSGSGPTVFGVFANKKARDTACKKISPLFGGRTIKAETIPKGINS